MTAPLERVIEQDAAAVGATAEGSTIVGQAPFDATVTRVAYIANSAITGAADDNRTVALINKGADGTGTTSIASLTFANGTDADADDDTPLTLSSTAAYLNVSKGDTLLWTSTHHGTNGMADPGGLVQVTLNRR